MSGAAQVIRLLLTIALACLGQPATAAAHFGLVKLSWEPMCQLSEELDGAGGGVLDAADSNLASTQSMFRAEIRLRIYVAKNLGKKDTTKAEILRALIGWKASQAITHFKETDIKKIIDFTRHTAYLKGRLDETLHLLAQAREATTNGCLLTTGSTLATIQADDIGGVTCRRKLSNLAKAPYSPQHATTAGFANLRHDTSAGNAAAHQGGGGECKLLVAEHTQGFMTADAAAAAIELAGGCVTVPTSDATINLADLTTPTKIATANKHVWTAAFEAIKNTVVKGGAKYTNDTTKVAGNSDTELVARAILTGKTEAAGTDTENKVAKIFGDNQEVEIKRILGEVDSTPIPANIGGVPSATTLGAIIDELQLQAVLSHYTLQHAQHVSELTQQILKQGSSAEGANEAECDKHKDNKTCTQNKCKWDGTTEKDGKCKVDGSKVTTQTTAGGTGEETGGTTDKCGKHKKQEECKDGCR
uniref:Variant surface glycoprotein 1137 n=1 Tax=Trypanosoma brucei TaxID=5691 RepID=M4SXQ6_9TRYP|nr:variant surface glycoprotein 1137 [Trypanosoma brucei]